MHRVAGIEDSYARILIRREHQVRALERAWSILMQVVRPEVAAKLAVVLLRRRGKSCHRYWLRLLANVNGPDVLHLVRTIVGNRFVQHHDEVFRAAMRVGYAIGQRHRRVRAAAKRWMDVEVR